MNEKCPFCDDAEVRERCIVRNEYVWVLPTNIPIVPMHILVAPVRHAATLDDLSADEIDALFEMVQRLTGVFVKKFGAEGFNFAWNQGELAGQSIPHLHLHLLPRKAGDTGITQYDPRTFLYRTDKRETASESELREVAKEIRNALGK